MRGLDIKPHSRRLTAWAVAGLTLAATGAFAVGVSRQMAFNGAAYFPTPQGQGLRASADLIPEATPAPDMQLAVADPPPVRHQARPAADDNAADAAEPAPDAAAGAPAASAPAATATVVDVSATAPDPSPAPAPPSATPPDNAPAAPPT